MLSIFQDDNIPKIWSNIGNLWKAVNKLTEHIFNAEWGIWHRIDAIETKQNNPEWGIKGIEQKFMDPEWGVWHQLNALQHENAQLKERLSRLEAKANNIDQLEIMLTNAVNRQLGQK